MSWLYGPPKSRTRTGRSSGVGSGPGKAITSAASATAVVGCVLRDRHIVRVALAQPCARDPDEARLLELVDRRRTAVAHRLPEPAHELVDDRSERPLVREANRAPLRAQL